MKIQFEGGTSLGDEDGRQAAAIMQAIWPDYVPLFWRELEVYRHYPDVFEPFFVLARAEGRVVGFSLLMASMMSTDLLAITWVAVQPGHHGQGIGQGMIDFCMAESRRRGKSVVLTTEIPAFYRKMGFKLLGEYQGKEANNFPGPEDKSFLLLHA